MPRKAKSKKEKKQTDVEKRIKQLEKKGYFVKYHGGVLVAHGNGERIEENYGK